MNDFLNSKLFADLKDGRLPEIQVAVSPNSLVQVCAGLFFTGLAIILMAKIVKSL